MFRDDLRYAPCISTSAIFGTQLELSADPTATNARGQDTLWFTDGAAFRVSLTETSDGAPIRVSMAETLDGMGYKLTLI
jgi:hypothetical protein